jgi:hypothetical protein
MLLVSTSYNLRISLGVNMSFTKSLFLVKFSQATQNAFCFNNGLSAISDKLLSTPKSFNFTFAAI